jgi:hypothetical protein
MFANSHAPDDVVALETTANALSIARILEPCVERVVLADPKSVKRITGLRAKTTRSTLVCWTGCWRRGFWLRFRRRMSRPGAALFDRSPNASCTSAGA